MGKSLNEFNTERGFTVEPISTSEWLELRSFSAFGYRTQSPNTIHENRVEQLRRDARRLAKSDGCPRHEALDRVAKNEGFASWSEMQRRGGLGPNAPFRKDIVVEDRSNWTWEQLINIHRPLVHDKTAQANLSIALLRDYHQLSRSMPYDWVLFLWALGDAAVLSGERSYHCFYFKPGSAGEATAVAIGSAYGLVSRCREYTTRGRRMFCVNEVGLDVVEAWKAGHDESR